MKKRTVAYLTAAAAVCVALVGGTLAYFTDTDSAENVFTVGNVQIEQKEVDENGNTFVQNQQILPLGNTTDKYQDENYVWKKVSVKNTGSEPAYVRTFIAIPLTTDANSTDNKAYNNWLHWNGSSATDAAPYINDWYWDVNLTKDWPGNGDGWNSFKTTIDGKPYNVFVATHKSALYPGNETGCSLRGFFLDSSVDVEVITAADGSKTYNYFYYPTFADGTRSTTAVSLGDISNLTIYAYSQAVQSTGFVDKNGNGTAADEAFAASGLPTNPWATA